MRIIEINVKEFGCLKDRVICPDKDLNIIYGENESGKSTLLLFIKFMLYGLGRRSASNSERDRSLSWSGKRAAGSMIFEHGQKKYRIERNFTESGKSVNDQVSIISLDDGASISTEKTPGEYFLGVPKEVFESSACVGQMRSAEINGEKTASSIENMLSSADESVDTAKVLKNLDALRVTYRHKNRNGGSLLQTEQRISALRTEVERARETAQNLELNERRLANLKSEYEIEKEKYDKADALLTELNKVGVVKRFGKLAKLRLELEELREKKNRVGAMLTHGAFTPTREHTAALRLSLKALTDSRNSFETKKEQAEREGAPKYDLHAAKLGEKAVMAGGRELIAAKAKSLSENVSKRSKLAVTSVILATVFAAVAAVLMAFVSLFGAFALVGTLLGAFMLISAMKAKKAAQSELSSLALEYEASVEDLSQKLALYVSEYERSKEFRLKKERIEAQLVYAENDLEEKKLALRALLSKTIDDPEPTADVAQTEFKRIESLIFEAEGVSNSIASVSRMIASEERDLENYDEAEIRSTLSVDADSVTPEEIANAERNRAFLSQKLGLLSSKISEIENTVTISRVNARDPLPLSDELAELNEKYRADSDFYDALTLAMESIETAANTMRGNVTPIISREAGDILSALSDGNYTGLLATSKFGVSLEKDGYTVKSEWLSAGTRDAAYLALRLSLFTRIYGAELPPLVLDESLCQLDEKRAERMLSLLSGFNDRGVQILLFTSHKREEAICADKNINYNLIEI